MSLNLRGVLLELVSWKLIPRSFNFFVTLDNSSPFEIPTVVRTTLALGLAVVASSIT